jgi:predicted Rossmann fold flavoprotein
MKLIVIGGGAAGFFCAVNAARLRPDLEVIMLEKSGKLLSKVRVSGGGRCNITHACFDITEMANRYPRGKNFVKKSFHGFFTSDTIQWFSERGVEIKTEADGRMFPVSNSSQSVIDCLMNEASIYGVDIRLNISVEGIERKGSSFIVNAKRGGITEKLETDFICIASGGFPKSQLYQWIRELGHSIAEPVPSLFTFNIPGNPLTSLMGISVEEAELKIPVLKEKLRGPLLITHWGLSGPVVLKLSAWAARELADLQYEFDIAVNWVPKYHESSMHEYLSTYRVYQASSRVRNKNPFSLPQRLWDFLLKASGIDNDPRWGELQSALQNRLVKNLSAFELRVRGKTTFKEEFVTAGGIVLSEIEPSTMMSRLVPNIFFAGEVMDVDGITGGYNFQHAWTSGYLAAVAIAKS